MRKIKYLLLMIVVLLLTGCSGNYNLKFNNDLSINEELNIFIDNKLDNYERTYNLLDQSGVDENDYTVTVVKDQINIVYKKKYNSFEDYYLNDSLYKVLFENVEFTKDNSGMKINAESLLKLDDKENENIINSYDIEDFNINLELPFSINKNNADKVDNNIYTWTLDNSDTYKNINIEFDYNNDKVQSIILLVLMGIISLGIISYMIIYFVRNQRI